MGTSWLDVRLGVRMLARYKGLSLAGGLALALAIGLGAAWYDVVHDQLHPRLPLPEGDRLVEIEVRNVASGGAELRLLHDVMRWRTDLQSLEGIGAYRTIERNLILGDARPEPVRIAEITPSAFRVARAAPVLGRPLLDADERPAAPPVVVLGYTVWQRQFSARPDVVGQTLQLGRGRYTIVGVMSEGFAFPENHRFWVPLTVRPSGYAPLEGPAVRIFGRLAPGAEPRQVATEIEAGLSRVAKGSPATHEHLRPKVLPYGADDIGGSWVDFAVTHGPVLLVLIVACANVGTLVYARTATREGEIALRHALGASRARIITQLFVEALVLSAAAATIGLLAADRALRWVYDYLAQQDALPFWITPGLEPHTVAYAGLLAVAAAGVVAILPAIKATGGVAEQLKISGAGGATLRFGTVWTTAMIAQVALTVICIVPAKGVSEEAIRDHRIRGRFPAAQYLAVGIEMDRDVAAVPGQTAAEAAAERLRRSYTELERRLTQEPGVLAVAFGDRLPGMGSSVRRAQLETSPGADPLALANLWYTSVGPGYFTTFERPIVSGRDFQAADTKPGAQGVIVNEAFARRFTSGGSPVGRRVRYDDGDPTKPQPWLDIIGMVKDVGMTPTDLGEAPYVYHPVSVASVSPLVMGIRLSGDPSALGQRLRDVAADVDPGLRLTSVQPLDAVVWAHDAPQLLASGGITGVVSLGLLLSAAGIFSLVSVSVVRRTREIGLRSALGATPARLLRSVLAHALVLIGSGIAAGNVILVLLVALIDAEDVSVGYVASELVITSMVMLVVGLLGCIVPARRALRVNPTEALKQA